LFHKLAVEDVVMMRRPPMRRTRTSPATGALALLAMLTVLPPRAARAGMLVPLPPQPPEVAWPTDTWPESRPGQEVDRGRLDSAFDQAFAAVGRGGLPDTRALLVVHHGAIVTERYAQGFGTSKRFQSWSMVKSITQALVGILVRQGTLDLAASAPVPAWQRDGDPRHRLTLDHLLHMTSGLANEDDTADPASSVAVAMLFGDRSAKMAEYAASLPLSHEPGTYWAYSTATSMIVADIVQRAVGGGKDDMLRFMRAELFDRIGMRSAVPEFDAGGTFMGGGFLYATARDYARFGYLYLRGGVWDGTAVLPPGWVDYTRTPAHAANNGVYGANFWLNLTPASDQFKILPGGPESAFAANGNDGQVILIVPTHDLVVVRLGEMQSTTWPAVNANLADIVAAFPAAQSRAVPGGETGG
jgi:CubicO group peptidase (beta-lactamase class C family)